MREKPEIYSVIVIDGEEACVVDVEDEPGGGFSIDYKYDDGEYGVIVVHPDSSPPVGEHSVKEGQ